MPRHDNDLGVSIGNHRKGPDGAFASAALGMVVWGSNARPVANGCQCFADASMGLMATINLIANCAALWHHGSEA